MQTAYAVSHGDEDGANSSHAVCDGWLSAARSWRCLVCFSCSCWLLYGNLRLPGGDWARVRGKGGGFGEEWLEEGMTATLTILTPTLD